MSDDRDIIDIQEDIQQNRQDLGRTIDQIEERLSPSSLQAEITDIVKQVTDQLMAEFESKSGEISSRITEQVNSAVQGATTARAEQLFSQVESAAVQAGRSLWSRIGENPAPVALAATAIGLLAAEGARSGDSQNGDGLLHQMKSAVGEQASGMKESLTSMTNQVSGSVGGILDDKKQQVGQLQQQMPAPKSFLQDQSLVTGLLVAGLGFVAALAVPQSEREREAMSPMIDMAQERLDQMGITDSTGQGDGGLTAKIKESSGDLVGQAKTAAKESLDRAGEAVNAVRQTAKETTQDSLQEHGLSR